MCLIVFLDIYAFTAKFVYVYVAHYFILLRLNPFDLSVDRQGWWFEHSVSQLGFDYQQRVLNMFPGPGYLRPRGSSSLTMAFTVHHVPKCMSCHKAIVVITGRAHCFYDNITYIIYIYTSQIWGSCYPSWNASFICKCQ